MKKITLILTMLFIATLNWQGNAQSTIHITTSGGSFSSEKWVNITDAIDGGGTQIWGQGDGTYGNTPGYIDLDINIAPGTYYVNCYDKYADGWDGTVISVTAYGNVIGDNGGNSPNDGTNNDATSAFGDTQAQELEASFQIIVPAPPSCLQPTNLSTTNLTATSADLNWTAATGAVDYNWEVQPQGTAQGTAGATANGTGVAGTTVNTGNTLTADTSYDFFVQTNCGGSTSSWAGPFTFYTGYCVSNPSSNDGNGISNVQISATNFANGDVTYFDHTGTVVDIAQNTLANLQITFETGYTYDTNVWIDFNDNLQFETSEQVFDGASTGANPTTLDASFNVDAAATLGNHRMRIGTADSGQGTPDPCYNGTYGVTLDFTVNVTPPPACLTPTALNVSYPTSTTANLAWTENNSPAATSWNVEWGATGFTQGTGTMITGTTTNPQNITGLTARTDYDFYVQTDCGSSTSAWAGPFTWTQPDNGDECTLPIVATLEADCATATPTTLDFANAVTEVLTSCDGFGNLGYWLKVNSGTLGAVKITNTGTSIGLAIYESCGGTEVYCANNTLGLELSLSGLTPNTDYYYYFWKDSATGTADICFEEVTCLFPTTLTTATTTTTADVSWTDNNSGSSTYLVEWRILGTATWSNFTTVAGATNYTITSLSPATTYEWQVTADCGGNGLSTPTYGNNFTTTPGNDTCVNLELLLVGTAFVDQEIITTNVSSTASGELPNPSCSSFGTGEDVWYGVIVPASGHVIIETASNPGSAISDTGMSLYSGNCGSLTEIDCDDDSGAGFFSKIEYFGTPDEVLFVRVFEYGNNTFDTFKISAYDGLCTGGTTTWTGAWDNGVPNNTMHAVINSYYLTNIQGPIDACSLEITINGNLVVYDSANIGQYVKVVNGILNNGKINVLETGNLVQVNDNTGVGGSYTQSRAKVITTTLQDEARYTYIGSPVQNQNTNGIFSWAQEVWDFNQATQFWNYLGTGTSANTVMGAGVGYAVSPTTANIGSTQTMYFDSGHFNNGVITRPLVLDVGTHEPTVPAGDDDATLVANPYPSGLDLIGASGLIASNTIDNVMIWTHASALDPGATTGFAGDDYIVCSLGGCTNAPTGGTHAGIAAVGQGFFVNASAAGTLTFNNSMRTTTGNNEFRRPNDANDDKVWINLGNSLGYNSNILLSFTNNGTTNFDAKYDAKKPLSTTFGTSFYSLNTDNQKLAINDTGLINESTSIPVGFIANDPAITDLSISIANIENLTDTNIYVVDHVLNITHDLKISDYNFTINNTGENNTRFEIVFSRTPLSVDNNNIANTNLTVSNFNETQVKVNMLDGSIIKNLKAFDALGRLVIDMDANSSNFILNKSFNQGQILIVKATLENGQVLTTKFIKL